MLSKLKYRFVLILMLTISAQSANAIQTIGALLKKLGEKENDIVIQMYSLNVEDNASVAQLFRVAARESRVELLRFLLTDKRVNQFKQSTLWEAFRAAAERGDHEVMQLFHETGNVTIEACFLQAARYQRTSLVRRYLNHARAAEIGQDAIANALFEATRNAHEDVVAELLEWNRLQPVDLAHARAIAVADGNEDLVERFDDQLRTYIRAEGLPVAVAIVLTLFYLARSH